MITLLVGTAHADLSQSAAALPQPTPSVSSIPIPGSELSQLPDILSGSGEHNANADFVWTLEEVQKIASNQNPDLKSARSNYEATAKVVGESVSGYLPHVDVEADFEQTTLPNPSALSSGLIGTAANYSTAIVSVRQLLFDFGKVLSQIQASTSRSHSAEQQAIAVKIAVKLSVQRAFYNVVEAQNLVLVAKEALKQFEETHRRTEVLVRTGARPAFDLTQANVELSKAKLGQISAENSRDLSKIALLNFMGIQKQVSFELKEIAEMESVTAQKLNLTKLTDEALKLRPEVHESEFSLDAVRGDLHAESRDYFPTISVHAWYARYLPDFPPPLDNSWGVGVGATWHIFEGLKTTFRVGELSARVDQQEANLEKTRESISAEVATSYMDLVRSESDLQVANETLAFAKENLRLADKRYQANVATILELLVAETSLVNSEAVAVQSRYRHEIALASLERAVNGPLLDK